MSKLKNAINVLGQSYSDYDLDTDPEYAYEMDKKDEPGFDPGPEKGAPREAVEEMEDDIVSILRRNKDKGFTRDELFKLAVRVKDYEKYDLDEYDIWRLFWDALNSLTEDHQIGKEEEVVELFFYD